MSEGERAADGGRSGAAREVVGPAPLAGLPSGLATRLARNGLATRGQVAAWYGVDAGAARPLQRIGPLALARIAAWLAADVEEGQAMTPDEVLQWYPREARRWLRARLGLSQLTFALEFDLSVGLVGHWEAQRSPIGATNRARLAALLAPHLETDEGRAWLATMDEVRRHSAQTSASRSEALRVATKVRDTARAAGHEAFARHEDAAIATLEARITRLERRLAEFEERQARRDGLAE